MKNDPWNRIMKLLLYWCFLGIIVRFQGTFFNVITIVFGSIIAGVTIKQLFLKRKN